MTNTQNQKKLSPESLLNPNTPLGVINITVNTLIHQLINDGWPVNTSIDFGCQIAEKAQKVVAEMRQRINESVTVQ